jgi:uncharacterized transporter YbjL
MTDWAFMAFHLAIVIASVAILWKHRLDENWKVIVWLVLGLVVGAGILEITRYSWIFPGRINRVLGFIGLTMYAVAVGILIGNDIYRDVRAKHTSNELD